MRTLFQELFESMLEGEQLSSELVLDLGPEVGPTFTLQASNKEAVISVPDLGGAMDSMPRSPQQLEWLKGALAQAGGFQEVWGTSFKTSDGKALGRLLGGGLSKAGWTQLILVTRSIERANRVLQAKVQGIRVRQLVAKLGDFRGAAAQGFARTDLFIVERPGGDFTVSASAYETEAKSKARKCPPFEALLAAAQAGGEVGFDGPRHAGEQRLRVLRPGWVERLVGSLANEPILELSALLETRDWEAPPS